MRWGRVAVVLVLAATSLVGVRAAAGAKVDTCNEGDRPETGIQGAVPVADQVSGASKLGYRCRIRPVGSNNLGGGGGDIQLTWYKQCAYQVTPKGETASDGIAVVDARDPAHPEHVETIRLAQWAGRGGTLGIHEGIHASERSHVLVVPIGSLLSVFDISNCRSPRHRYDIELGTDGDPTHSDAVGAGGVHSGQLSPDGTIYYATDIGNGAVAPNGPCLTVVDLVAREVITRWGLDFPCHDLELKPDGTRAYVGYYAAKAGHPSAVVGAFTPVGQPAHALSGIKIVDITRVREGVLTELAQLEGGRQHTEVYARIGNDDYLLGAEEAYCPGGNGRIVRVTDDEPVEVAELTLEVNQAPNCAQSADNANGDVLHYMSHYLSVDDPNNAKLAFYTWYGAGLRVFDISDPAHPREVAYYNPPVGPDSSRTHDSSTTYPRYLPTTGQIWFGSRVNGFNVVELDPALRPDTGATWSAAALAPKAVRSLDVGADAEPVGYCTLR